LSASRPQGGDAASWGVGTLYRRTGKRELAQEHLTAAAMMYREMDMRFYLYQAQVEMKRLAW